MQNVNKPSPGKGLLTFFAIIASVTSMWWFLSQYWILPFYEINSIEAGQKGDSYGILNSLFAALAFAGLVYTILLQQRELHETREEFIKQNSTLRFQRFENTLFNLLSGRNNLISELTVSVIEPTEFEGRSNHVTYKGRNLFIGLIKKMRELLRTQDISVYKETKAVPIDQFTRLYNVAIHDYEVQLELYISNLSSILKFIRDSDLLSDESERILYFSIVRSQLSLNERTFLYYFMAVADGNSPSGKYIHTIRRLEKCYKFNEFTSALLFHSSHTRLQLNWNGFEFYEEEDLAEY